MAVTVSIDAGNGSTIGIHDKHTVVFPSFSAPRRIVNMDRISMDVTTYERNGETFVFGDDVLRLQSEISSHRGASKYGSEFHIRQILVALTQLELGTEPSIELLTYAPPALLQEAKDAFKEWEGTKQPIIVHSGDEATHFVFHLKKITVLPEGLGALGVYLFDEKGKPKDISFSAGNVMVLDSGAFSLDVMLFNNMKLATDRLNDATRENYGLFDFVIANLKQDIVDHDSRFRTVKLAQIEATIRHAIIDNGGELPTSIILEHGNNAIDIGEHVSVYVESLAKNIYTDVLVSNYDLTSIGKLVVIGGCGALIHSVIKPMIEQHGTKVYLPDSPITVNARGGLNFHQSRKARKA